MFSVFNKDENYYIRKDDLPGFISYVEKLEGDVLSRSRIGALFNLISKSDTKFLEALIDRKTKWLFVEDENKRNLSLILTTAGNLDALKILLDKTNISNSPIYLDIHSMLYETEYDEYMHYVYIAAQHKQLNMVKFFIENGILFNKSFYKHDETKDNIIDFLKNKYSTNNLVFDDEEILNMFKEISLNYIDRIKSCNNEEEKFNLNKNFKKFMFNYDCIKDSLEIDKNIEFKSI
jgi:hypothetical protein